MNAATLPNTTLSSSNFKRDRAFKATLFPPYDEYDALLAEGRIHDAIDCIVQVWGYVCQGELLQFLKGSLPTEGNYALKVQPNVEVWRGLSEELGQILTK